MGLDPMSQQARFVFLGSRLATRHGQVPEACQGETAKRACLKLNRWECQRLACEICFSNRKLSRRVTARCPKRFITSRNINWLDWQIK
jgi:hypothetical protein